MKSVYRWMLLISVCFLIWSYSYDGRLYLGYAGHMGIAPSAGYGVSADNPNVVPAKATAVYYEPTIKGIITADCAKCHSGPTRNLMDYDNLKQYADSGMLATMVQGPMRRFAGNDAQTIVTWAENGAPEKSAGMKVFFQTGNGVPADNPNLIPAKATAVYYEPTIKDIVTADCAQCHSGGARNLMDYDSLKMYADSGLLSAMVQGAMGPYAGADAQTIVTWADNGAPEKPAAMRVFFRSGNCPPVADIPQGTDLTYTNGIRQVLAKDCLRCHSGPFRNLTTYKNVKIYVDNGLLKTLVSLGGPMHRFAGPDSRLIITWIENGAPQ